MYDDVYIEPELLDTVEKIAAHEQELADDPEAIRHEYALKLIDKADKQGIKFCNALHKGYYGDILSAMKSDDCYHRSMAYLLALDSVLREHIEAVFDFQEDSIKLDGLHKGFQTGTSMKTTRLAFNLWNGCHDDGETYSDKDGYEADLPSRYYAPDEIFCCTEYAPYYYEAIRIRFGYDAVQKCPVSKNTIVKLWEYIRFKQNSISETWDDLTAKIGLTSNELAELMGIEFAPEWKR